jgi:hypothetical protein
MATESIVRRGYEGVVLAFNPPVPAREVSLVRRRGQLKRGIERALRETIENSLPPNLQRKKSRDLNVLSLMGQFK